MPGYTTIKGDVLDYDRRIEGLSDRAYRLLMLSLYSKGRTMLGLMRWVPADSLPRVAGWDLEQVEQALEELVQAGLVQYDAEARLLFNPYALDFAPVRGINQVRGAATVLRELPDSQVMIQALGHVLQAAQAERAERAARSKDAPGDLHQIIQELEIRLKGLQPEEPATETAETPLEGVQQEAPTTETAETPSEGVSKGVDTPCQGVSEGYPRGSEGVWEGYGRGSGGGLPRARARPDPDPEPESPPKPPPNRPAGGVGAGARGREGEGRYAHLDQRGRK